MTSLGQRDYDTLRLILDENLAYPTLSSDKRGYVIKLPTPHAVNDNLYTLHGLYTDQDESSWITLWRLFKASLYHTALHAAYSDFAGYAAWAKGKDLSLATFSVSLVEDLHVTAQAAKRWPGALQDIAYANYVSGLRATDPTAAGRGSLRDATSLLLTVWGISRRVKNSSEEERKVEVFASKLRASVNAAVSMKADERKNLLLSAAQEVYFHVARGERLPEIPFLPYTEAHGDSSLFDSKLVARPDDAALLASAYGTLGLAQGGEEQLLLKQEATDAYLDMKSNNENLSRIKAAYESLASTTRLETVSFPQGDYGMFLRVKSALSGPIGNVKNQLRQVRNVLDETGGHEAGQLDVPAAMQVVASNQVRSDVFFRLEDVHKDEAWAILVDASKSISSFSHEVKGIATCLSEVANDLITKPDQWALFSFNNSFEIMKDFDEDYSITTKARLGALTQRNMTLLPDAMRVANGVLASKPVDVRIIVLVSDGYPTGYKEIEKSLVETIKEISRSGTMLIGVGINSHEIEEYFTVHCVLDSPYQMMKTFVKAYLELSSLF